MAYKLFRCNLCNQRNYINYAKCTIKGCGHPWSNLRPYEKQVKRRKCDVTCAEEKQKSGTITTPNNGIANSADGFHSLK